MKRFLKKMIGQLSLTYFLQSSSGVVHKPSHILLCPHISSFVFIENEKKEEIEKGRE